MRTWYLGCEHGPVESSKCRLRRTSRAASRWSTTLRTAIVASSPCSRRGIQCRIPMHTTQMREESFLVRGPRIFNVLPLDLRMFSPDQGSKESGVEGFKRRLDQFLQSVPDKPNRSQDYSERIGTVDLAGNKTNSLIHVLKYSNIRMWYYCNT